MSHIDRIAEAICGTTSAGKLFPWAELSEPQREAWRKMARAAIAELHPVIETVEQLDALPFLTIVREVCGPSPSGCDYGAVWERRTSGWHCIAGTVMPPGHRHTLPRLGCRVLYTPEADR